jgi:hypothetical protein
MPITDLSNTFSEEQTTTTGTGSASTPGVRSTNIFDIQQTGRVIGAGTPIAIECLVTTALASAGSNDAMNVWLASDDAETFDTPATLHQIIGTFAAISAIGTRFVHILQPTQALLRYIGLYYISATTDAFSAGAVTARVLLGFDVNTIYAKGYTAG